jgi:hypothetical protein
VFNSRPPVRKLLPEWDLPLVLDMLKKRIVWTNEIC